MSDVINKTVTEAIERRAWMIAHKLAKYWPDEDKSFECVIAGGCLGDTINDVDIFPLVDEIIPPTADVITSTRNATTLDTKPWPVQLCSYKKPSLEELVAAFDYAHIQAGAVVELGGYPSVKRVYFTEAFVAARATHSTWFTGSEYPLSSIMRAGKYFKSGAIHRPTYIRCVISALTETVKRGFKDYEDFKDQIDAVDLGLLPDEQEEVSRNGLMNLFDALKK